VIFKKIFNKNFLLSFINLTLAFWVPAFYLYSVNVGDALLVEFLFLLTILFLTVFFLLYFTKKFFNSYFKSSLFFSILYLGVFLGANIYRQIYTVESFLSFLKFLKPAYFLGIYFFFLFLLLFFIFKTIIRKRIINFLILVFSYLIIFYLFNIYSSYRHINKYIKLYKKQNIIFRNKFKNKFLSLNKSLKNEDKRDIYYIILDAHASINDLKQYHNYNYDKFEKKLEDMGFIFPKNSKSNYDHTIQSLPSSLSMRYLLNANSYKNLTFGVSSYLIRNNNFKYFTNLLGYKFINIPSSWTITRAWQRKFSIRDLFFGDFVQHFLYSFTSRKIFYPLYAYIKRKELLDQLNCLYEKSKTKDSKVIFAHFLCPHFPYVFKKDGSLETKDKMDNQSYLDQMDFFDKQIIKFLNFVISNSKVKPIIILQSDHSSHGYTFFPKMCSNFTKKDKENLKFNILSTFYLPGINKKDLPKDISPVNNFRFIFNKYFGTNFKILENKQIG
jgi:hypothetical protein